MSARGWRKFTLDQIKAQKKWAINGGPFGSELVTKDYVEQGVPVIRGGNVSKGVKFSFEDIAFVSEEKADLLLANNAHPGDVIFTQRGTLGQVGLIPKDSPYDRYLISQSQMKLTVDEAIALAEYVYYYFKQQSIVDIIVQAAITSGVPHINLRTLKNLEILLPDVSVQERIISILSSYDDLIENNTRRIALLEESMRLLYREWFVRLCFPGHEGVKVVDGLPEGWEKKPLEQICDLTMGQSPPSDTYNQDGDGLPFHQGVTRFGGRFVTHDTFCTQANRVAEPGDILFSVRAPVGRINITLDKIVIGRGLSAMRSKTGHQSFLFYQLKSHFFKEDMLGGGAIFASVTKQQLSSEMLLAPKLRIVDEFESIAKPVDQQIVNLHMQNQRLIEARDLLLPRLMSGEIAL